MTTKWPPLARGGQFKRGGQLGVDKLLVECYETTGPGIVAPDVRWPTLGRSN